MISSTFSPTLIHAEVVVVYVVLERVTLSEDPCLLQEVVEVRLLRGSFDRIRNVDLEPYGGRRLNEKTNGTKVSYQGRLTVWVGGEQRNV